MRPDFLIVGAFKAGTTALYEYLRVYLRVHPDLFMSVPKEPMYFGQDLTPRYRRMTQDEYLALFKDARAEQHAGEVSPWYTRAPAAPRALRRGLATRVCCRVVPEVGARSRSWRDS